MGKAELHRKRRFHERYRTVKKVMGLRDGELVERYNESLKRMLNREVSGVDTSGNHKP